MPLRSATLACLVAAVASASVPVSDAVGENATRPIWLIGMLSMTSTTIASKGISYWVGATLMLEEINRNPALLPGYELKVVWQDDHCDAAVGTMHMLDNMFEKRYEAFAPGASLSELETSGDGRITTEDVEGFFQVWNASQVSPDPFGLIGPSCSNVALAVANIAYKARLPLISPTATRPILSDREHYPNFFRTMSPDTAYSQPWIAMARLLGQTSVVVVIAEAANWHSGATDLAKAAAEQGVELAGPDLDHEIPGFRGLQITMDSATVARGTASELLRLKRRVVIFLTYDARARLVMCEAYRLGFLSAIYMVLGWFVQGWWTIPDTGCTVEELTQMAMHQVVVQTLSFRKDSATPLSCSSGMSSGTFKTKLEALQVNASQHGYIPTGDSAFFADAICMYALMLHEVLLNQGMALAELSARTSRAYAAVQAALSRSDFEGVSGRLTYEPGKADPTPSVIVRQVQAEGTVDIATYVHPQFQFLGKANLTFHFPGEKWFAGPAGAATIEVRLTPFATCPKGMFLNTSNNFCEECPQHMEFAEAADTCLCVEGFHASPSGGCVPCEGGTFSDTAGTLECKPCQAGKYSGRGATSCSFCPRGSFSDSNGASSCTRCPSMQTTEEISATSLTQCICDRGSYRVTRGDFGTVCQACPVHANTSGIGSARVADCKCKKGMYMSSQRRCTACPLGSTTEDTGKTDVLSCLCAQGEFMPLGAAGCRPCPAVMRCPRGSNEANFVLPLMDEVTRPSEERFPLLLPRYWSSAADPLSVFDCKDEKRCRGGVPGRSCAPKLLDAYACQRCIDAHYWNGDECVSCKASAWTRPALSVGLGIGLPLLIVILYMFSGGSVEMWSSRANTIGGLIFVTLSFYQIIGLVIDGALLPMEQRKSTGVIAWANQWFRIFDPECTGMVALEAKMATKAATPVVVLVVCLLTYAISASMAHMVHRGWLRMDANRLFNIFGSLCFTFFGALAFMSMSLFRCNGNPNGHLTLASDLSVICFSSSQWRTMLGLAIACVLTFVVGIASVFVRTIIGAPAHFQDKAFQVRWKFLFIKFHAGAYWWGIVHLAKNTILQATTVLFGGSGWGALFAALVVLTGYAGIVMLVTPFRTIVVNILEGLSTGCLVIVTAVLFLLVDGASGYSSKEVIVVIVTFGSLPVFLMVLGAIFEAIYGKRAHPTMAQMRRAERDFKELSECAEGILAMDKEAGPQFLIWCGDLEQWAFRHSAKILRADLLGKRMSSRISYTTAPDIVRTSIRNSNRSNWSQGIDGALRRLPSREDKDAATGSGGETSWPLPSEGELRIQPSRLTEGVCWKASL